MRNNLRKDFDDMGGLANILFGIPDSLANAKLPCVEEVLEWKEIQDRRLVINEDFTGEMIRYVQLIIQWNSEDKGIEKKDRKPIKILLHSFGGELEVCNLFSKIIEMSNTPVWIINIGVAASCGAILFISGHRRLAMPGSKFLFHEGQLSISGENTKVQEHLDMYKKTEAELETQILSKTKIDKTQYRKNRKKEWWIDHNLAVELGVADEIVTDIDMLYN